LIGFIIIYNAWGILRDMEILLESTPRDVDMQSMWKNWGIEGVLGTISV
jgi:hypothetical protein